MTLRSFIAYASLAIMALLIGSSVGYILYSAWDLPEVHALEHFKPSVTTRVYSDSSDLLAEFFVENRTPVQLTDVPDAFLKALIGTEDTRFYSHSGLDYRGIARAFVRNVQAGKVLEGGSTLTQQLAKVLFLTPERSYLRKIKEMALALKIEQRYTKQEIKLYPGKLRIMSGVSLSVTILRCAGFASRCSIATAALRKSPTGIHSTRNCPRKSGCGLCHRRGSPSLKGFRFSLLNPGFRSRTPTRCYGLSRNTAGLV